MHLKQVFLLIAGLFILITTILAVVYLLQNQMILKAKAGDCRQYSFYVTSSGAVTVTNRQAVSVPAQPVSLIINGTPTATLSAPALQPGQSSTFGAVPVPQTGKFTWNAVGAYFCGTSGSHI